jgi:hypothetical protein
MLAYTAGQMAAGVIVNLVVSAVVGLAVLFYGRNRGLSTLGIVGFILCIVVGFFLSFFAAIILAILFLIAIWASSRGRSRSTVAV